MKRNAITAMLALAALAAPAAAKNVDLVTLPRRDTVQLTIYNSEDITLVKETRFVTVKKGANRLQFSWANTLIDPSSVEIRPLDHADDIEIADTVFPGQKPQHLFWNIDSKFEGQVKVEVTYFTSGLTWSMDYVSIVDPPEERMQFRGYVRVFNRSGEEYEDAEIRLIVGTINLVEKIADLARRRGIPVPKPAAPALDQMRRQVMRNSLARAAEASRPPLTAPAKPKAIVKEGLSEYFMFEVNLGPDDLVVYETRKMATERLNFHFRRVNNREYVDGSDEKSDWVDTIRNYRTKPIAFELRRQWGGHVDYSSEMKTTLFDYRTAETKFTVDARGKREYPCTVVRHLGSNAKQSRINLKRPR